MTSFTRKMSNPNSKSRTTCSVRIFCNNANPKVYKFYTEAKWNVYDCNADALSQLLTKIDAQSLVVIFGLHNSHFLEIQTTCVAKQPLTPDLVVNCCLTVSARLTPPQWRATCAIQGHRCRSSFSPSYSFMVTFYSEQLAIHKYNWFCVSIVECDQWNVINWTKVTQKH